MNVAALRFSAIKRFHGLRSQAGQDALARDED